MAMETYALVVSEADSHEGVMGDVYNEDGTIEESLFLRYDDYGLTADREEWEPEDRRREFTADVTTLNLEVAREDGFEFRVRGDGNEELVSEHIPADDWELRAR